MYSLMTCSGVATMVFGLTLFTFWSWADDDDPLGAPRPLLPLAKFLGLSRPPLFPLTPIESMCCCWPVLVTERMLPEEELLLGLTWGRVCIPFIWRLEDPELWPLESDPPPPPPPPPPPTTIAPLPTPFDPNWWDAVEMMLPVVDIVSTRSINDDCWWCVVFCWHFKLDELRLGWSEWNKMPPLVRLTTPWAEDVLLLFDLRGGRWSLQLINWLWDESKELLRVVTVGVVITLPPVEGVTEEAPLMFANRDLVRERGILIESQGLVTVVVRFIRKETLVPRQTQRTDWIKPPCETRKANWERSIIYCQRGIHPSRPSLTPFQFMLIRLIQVRHGYSVLAAGGVNESWTKQASKQTEELVSITRAQQLSQRTNSHGLGRLYIHLWIDLTTYCTRQNTVEPRNLDSVGIELANLEPKFPTQWNESCLRWLTWGCRKS